MKTLYFDEAGYTGADLINKNQPFYVLSSVCFSDDELDAIKNDISLSLYGKELHFKKMYTNYQGRNMIKMLFSHPLMDLSHVKLAFAQKRFCVYAQIVDILVETYYHENNVNIHKGANGLILANGLYYCAVNHPNQLLIERFEADFVNMIRHPSTESVAIFYRTTDELMKNCDTNSSFQELLLEIPYTIKTIGKALPVDSFHMDLTIPLFSSVVQSWYKETGIKYNVIFDRSEPFYANLDFVKSLRDMNVPETEVGYGDSDRHVYPLPVESLSVEDSHKEFGIQIADICASSLCFILHSRDDKFAGLRDELRAFPIFSDVKINVAPSSLDYLAQRANDTEGIDPLDFLCENAFISK